jgi:hypothetical protein
MRAHQQGPLLLVRHPLRRIVPVLASAGLQLHLRSQLVRVILERELPY